MRTQGFALSSGTLRAGVFGFQARVWFAGLLGAFVGIGCDNAQETEHDAPRDVEGAADSAADGEVTAGDTAAVDVADTAQGDSDDAAVADAKDCPPGAQIEGCPCQVAGKGCCLTIGSGLNCSHTGPGKNLPLVWVRTADCCMHYALHCSNPPPDSGQDPLCLSKSLP
jgi:hypothetical protein